MMSVHPLDLLSLCHSSSHGDPPHTFDVVCRLTLTTLRYLLIARNLHGTVRFNACDIDPELMINIQRVLHQGPPLFIMHPHREAPV